MQAAGQSSRRLSHRAAKDEQSDSEVPARPKPGGTPEHAPDRTSASGRSGQDDVPDDQVQTALVNILKSPEFRSAPQLRAFLEFVVRATLNNQHEKIKGYTIAVEALGRPVEFNPVTDPIVRVEAARLRRRLETYYQGSGAQAPVRITIPKGSYAPDIFPIAPAPVRTETTGDAEHLAAEDATPRSTSAPLPDSSRNTGPPEADYPDDGSPQMQDAFLPDAPPLNGVFEGPGGAGARWPSHGEQAGDQPGSFSQRRVRLPVAIALGTACFLIGYLAGSL